MSNKREPLLSDADITKAITNLPGGGAHFVRDTYEAARAKDADLIQRLVDVSAKCVPIDEIVAAIAAAEAAGFKPSEP